MSADLYGWWLPPNISTQGIAVDRLIDALHWFMALLFVGWGVFFVYCLIRFRQRRARSASYVLPAAKASKWAEVFVAGFEAFLLIGLSMPAWASVKNDFPTEDQHPLHVRVVAEQFAWNFHYPGADGVFGATRPELMSAENLVGLDDSDPAAADDIVTNNIFHIPVNRPLIVDLTSKDVIHSFSIPVMRVKQDVLPGMKIPIWFEATKTGHFQVVCAQLCGNNHYTMHADLYVETVDQFQQWTSEMASQEEDEEEEDDAG